MGDRPSILSTTRFHLDRDEWRYIAIGLVSGAIYNPPRKKRASTELITLKCKI